MALTTAQGSAAYLNRAFNDANESTTTFAATSAGFTANEIAAANKYDVPALTDAALAKQVLTNMGLLPTTNASIAALEPALADYFATTGKGNRGFVVLQLSRILADKVGDSVYGTAAVAWNTEVSDSVVSSTGALTTAATDNLVGGSGDDIFTAISSALANNTLSATDKVDGGAGTNDILRIDLQAANSAMTTGSVTNVETVEVTNNTEASLALNATGFAGVKTYTFNATNAPITATNFGTGVTTININNQNKSAGATASTTFSSTFAAGASELTATTDTVALNLSSVGASSTKLATLTIGSVENLNVNLTGSNFAKLSGTDASKVVVTGSGSNNFSTVPTSLTSFDASAATGAITVDLSSSVSTITKVALGSGSDTVTYEEQDGSAIATLSGGAGVDKLTLKSDGGITEYTMTGFETLALTTVTGALTMSGSKTTDVATISTNSVTDADVTFVNMGSSALSFEALGITPNRTITSDHTGATTLTYKVNLGDATGADTPLADYAFSDTSALTVAVNSFIDASGSSITANKASTVALTVASGKNAGGTELTTYNNTITANKASSFSVNATGQLGSSAAISSTTATSGTVTNGASTGNLALVTPALKSLTVTTDNTLNLLQTSTNLNGLETLNVSTSKGAVTLGGLAKAATITASGAGTTSAVTLGALGATTNAADLSITTSGLKGGFTAQTLNVATGFDVKVDATGATGSVTLGAIARGDDVTVTASGIGGAFTIGNVAVTGDVNINASNATGIARVGTVSGDNVTVNVSGSAATSSFGAVTAKTSATLAASAVDANTFSVTASSTSTALAVNVTGGVTTDTVTVTGVNGQTSITLTGDLGAGTDTVTVTSDRNTSSTTAQTINISAVKGYETATLTSGIGADTITGGVGVDTIIGGKGADTLTGGAGADIFVFNSGDSSWSAPDTITDLGSTDIIAWGGGVTTTAYNGVGSSTVATISNGVATFALTTTATAKDTLDEVVQLIDNATTVGQSVLFSFGGDTYFFIDGGTTLANDVVVKLTGVVIAAAAAVADSTPTGLTGIGA